MACLGKATMERAPGYPENTSRRETSNSGSTATERRERPEAETGRRAVSRLRGRTACEGTAEVAWADRQAGIELCLAQ